jgi:DNA-binding GntR family transcriptional regulator
VETSRKSLVSVTSSEDYAYVTIRNLILKGHYAEGDRLRYIDLSKMLKMSKTPIISALSRLAKDGMTEYEYYHGYKVAKISRDGSPQTGSFHKAMTEKRSGRQSANSGDPMSSPPGISVSQEVYEIIKDHIMSSKFVPGQKLVGSDLEEKYGVSKTPIIQALGRLESEGYVRLKRNAGYYVREFNLEDVEGLFLARTALELANLDFVIAQHTEEDLQELEGIHNEMLSCTSPTFGETRLAINRRFHLKLASSGHNTFMIENITRVYDFYDIKLKLNFSFMPPDLVTAANVEHARILAAFREGDQKLLKKALQFHLTKAAQNLLTHLRDNRIS